MLASILRRFLGRKDGDKSGTKYIEDDRLPDAPYVAASVYYIAVVLFIGLPIWFLTCSTTRHALPNIEDLGTKLSNPPPKTHFDISLVQLSNDEQIDALRTDLSNQLKSHRNIYHHTDWRIRRATQDEDNLFKVQLKDKANTQKYEAIRELESGLVKIHKCEDRFRLFMYLIDASLQPIFCDQLEVPNYLIGFERFVYLCPRVEVNGKLDNIAGLISNVLDDIYSNSVDIERAKQILSPKVDLLMSILPENDRDTGTLSNIADKLHAVFQKNVKESFRELAELANIRLRTQFVVNLIDNKLNTVDRNESRIGRYVASDEMSKLFHQFESRTMKHFSQNVNNVLIIAPDSSKPRLSFESALDDQLSILEGADSKSILIYDGDKSLVLGMRAVIRRLIGLASVDLCPRCLVKRDTFFNRWEIDSIMGVLTTLKLQSVYLSIKSIKDQKSGVRIPKDVSLMAKEAFDSAMKSVESLHYKKSLDAYRLSSQAFELSEAAYYDASLLDHPNFPEELKYAIYLPLFFPLAAPFVKSILFVLKYFYQRRFNDKQPKMKTN